jgi:20S proteasome alpha/beta subunit
VDSKENRVTIAVGFRCFDGVVIATDSQYTLDIAKGRGQKIFPIPTNGHYALTIGGAGASDQIKWTVAEIERSLAKEIGARRTTSEEIREVIEAVLQRSYAAHVDTAPEDERVWLEYGLLIGIWTAHERTILYKSARTIVTEVAYPNHVGLGIGSYLTDFVLAALFDKSWKLYVDEAASVSAYIVTAAKDHVEGCGGDTFVRILDDEGHDVRVGPDEVNNAVEYYKDLFMWTSSMRKFLSRGFNTADLDMVPFANILRDQVVKFRELQDRQRSLSDQRIVEHGKKPIT